MYVSKLPLFEKWQSYKHYMKTDVKILLICCKPSIFTDLSCKLSQINRRLVGTVGLLCCVRSVACSTSYDKSTTNRSKRSLCLTGTCWCDSESAVHGVWEQSVTDRLTERQLSQYDDVLLSVEENSQHLTVTKCRKVTGIQQHSDEGAAAFREPPTRSFGVDTDLWQAVSVGPLELHLAISELWFGQEWEGILLELLFSSSIV